MTIVSQILDNLPQLDAIHAWLPSHYWPAFVDVMRDRIAAGRLGHGLAAAAGCTALCLSLAWARFAGKDVTA